MQAVELAEQTDFLWDRGDTLLTLARVLRLLERRSAAAAAADAAVRFPRPGRRRLIIPSGAPEGFMIPPPVVRPASVHR
jgi:hypothetical protein